MVNNKYNYIQDRNSLVIYKNDNELKRVVINEKMSNEDVFNLFIKEITEHEKLVNKR